MIRVSVILQLLKADLGLAVYFAGLTEMPDRPKVGEGVEMGRGGRLEEGNDEVRRGVLDGDREL